MNMADSELAFHLARILTCGIWFGAGVFKVFHFGGFTAKMRGYSFPIPPLSAAFVIAVELIGTLCLVLNLYAWAVALIWIAFTLWATWIEHRHILDRQGAIVFPEYVQVWKNVTIIGGLLYLILLDMSRPEWLL